MSMGVPDITVVVVTWNGLHLLRDCLRGLTAQDMDRQRWQVLVVDNDSSDGTADFLARCHPEIRVVWSPFNRGFAGGAQLGLSSVETPYAVLINNDAIPEPGFLSALLATVEAADAERVAAVTGKVLLRPRFRMLPAGVEFDEQAGDVLTDAGICRPDPEGPVDVLNSTGNEMTRAGFGRDRGWLRVDGGSAPPAEVFAFCGAAALVRTAAVRAVGGFDEDFFLYYEDTDLSWRLRAGGWEIRYQPRAVVRHAHAASSDVGSALFRFYDDRNRLLTLAKNAPAGMAVRAALRYLLTVASLTVRLGPTAAMTGVRIHAFGSYLWLLPRMLVRRARIARTASVSPRQIAALFVDDSS